jgi:hypothetical protein
VEPQRISFNVRAHNGVLHRDPIARTGKNGGQFVTAQLRYRVGQETACASVIVFAEDARTELLRLKEDDALTVQGEGRLSTYQGQDGTTRPSLSVTADHVLALRQPKRPKTSAAAEQVERTYQ